MILVFDLDDTLYEELSFVRSGFRAVAEFLGSAFNLQPNRIFKEMITGLKSGRGNIFDAVLIRHGIFSKKLLKKCVDVYHWHKPDIKLYKDAERCLERFGRHPIYIVTDGHKITQQNKIESLKIGKKVKKVFIARRYGIKNEKPSPHCFLKICALEKVSPRQVIFVADNPHKDFIGIKSLGFGTVRIRRGNYAHITLDKNHEAEREIKNLDELKL